VSGTDATLEHVRFILLAAFLKKISIKNVLGLNLKMHSENQK